jgi:signal transduction histidine kinase/ligand-binding sensor domain-containing protein
MMNEFFSVKSGIPQSQVLSLAEDKKFGYLWVGTNGGGVAQFDGKTFKTYTVEDGLIDNTILKILIDSHSNVWFGAASGLSKFDGKNFKNFHFSEPLLSGLVEYGDTIMVSSRNFGIVKIVSDSILAKPRLPTGSIQIPLFVTINSNELYQLIDDTISYRSLRGVAFEIDVSNLGYVHNFIDVNNTPYLITTMGAYKIESGKLTIVDSRINFHIVLASEDFSTLWKNDHSNLIEVKRLPTLQYDTIAKGMMALRGIIDSENNCWFGMNGNGLLKRSPTDFEKIQSGMAFAVYKEKEKLWVGTNRLSVFRNNTKVQQFDIKNDRGQGIITAIESDSRGNKWVLGGFNLARIDSATDRMKMYEVEDGLKSSYINDIEVDNKDNVWLCYRRGASSGVGVIRGSKYEDFKFNDQLSSRLVLSIKNIPYGNRILFLTRNGADQLVDGKLTKLKIPKFDQTTVYCATPYKRNFAVIGSAGRGICVYNFDTDSVKYISKKEGLVSGLIYFLNVDKDGYIWVGSNRGIERIRLDENMDINEYLYFSEANGLGEPETNFNACYFYEDEKYFGLIDGLYSYKGSDADTVRDFPLHFTKVVLTNSRKDVSSFGTLTTDFFKIPSHLELPYNENSLQFSFAKISKRYPRSAEYRFKLEGLDNDWTTQSNGEVSYRNLPDGSYSFNVLARKLDGKWMTTPLTYSFTINPPLYKRPLFVVLAILFLMVVATYLVYSNVKRRVNKMVRLEKIRAEESIKLRKEIGRDFHDEIGNQLARIVNYVGLIKLNHGNSNETLARVVESAQSLIGGTKDFVWALDHTNDSSMSLFIHLKDFGDRLFGEKEIEFRAFNEVKEDLALPVGHTRQINLIFKEVMTNAFKHSKATYVNMYFKKVLFGLAIVIEDNGIGLPKEKLNVSSGGLSNIRVRANRIQAKLVVLTLVSGTQIKLVIELK